MNTLKLRPLIENFQTSSPSQELKKEWTTEEKKSALENIGCYNEYAKHLHRETNLMEVSHKLSEIVKCAEELAVHETSKVSEGDTSWFDVRTVGENFKHATKAMQEFMKLAQEAHVLEQRMQAKYEDIGHILERYYEVKNLEEGATASCKIADN